MSTYIESKIIRDALDRQHAEACKHLNSIPGVGTGHMGLTPDHVKASTGYKLAKQIERSCFANLRAFNAKFVKQFKKEIRAERKG